MPAHKSANMLNIFNHGMDYYTVTTFEIVAFEQIKFAKFSNSYHSNNSLNDFEASVERGGCI